MNYKELAREVFDVESKAILGLSDKIDDNFISVIELLLFCSGNVIISGVGKSGVIAEKIAATLSSIGTNAFYISPLDLFHGSLSAIKREDIFIAISHSGETSELLRCIEYIRNQGTVVVAITGNITSSLATLSDHILNVAVEKEACPLNVIPTASSVAALAMGDAIVSVLVKAKGITMTQFQSSHPGGYIGKYGCK